MTNFCALLIAMKPSAGNIHEYNVVVCIYNRYYFDKSCIFSEELL